MRIVILTVGSRGDIQPYVALGLGLHQAGHSVRLAASVDFEALVGSRGLDFAPVAGSIQALMASEAGRRWMASGRSSFAYYRRLQRVLRPLGREFLDRCWTACQGAEALIAGTLGYPAWHIAEKLGVPSVMAHYHPFSQTWVSPSLFRPWSPRPAGLVSRLRVALGQQLIWQYQRPMVNRWRRETLDLPPFPLASPAGKIWRRRIPYLYGYSPQVVPTPPDWPPWYHVTGYWFLDRPAGWQPPADLVAFLDAGPPPVYIGFGSMIPRDPAAVTEIALDALRQTGQRGLLHAGWSGLGKAALPDDVFLIDDVPHDWLFPRLAAVVHHGGAGTTASGMRAGIPSIIVPFFYDQPFWGERVAALGVGPPPIPLRRLSAARLAEAIRTATGDTGMRDRAAALGERIRAEDGVAPAVEVFHAHLHAVV